MDDSIACVGVRIRVEWVDWNAQAHLVVNHFHNVYFVSKIFVLDHELVNALDRNLSDSLPWRIPRRQRFGLALGRPNVTH